MSFLASAADERVLGVEFSDDALSVSLRDGRIITVPLVWYPRLLEATPSQRKNWKVSGGGYGIHWPDIDEDLSTEGLLRGAPAPRASVRNFQAKANLGLSNREQQLVLLIGQGLTNKEIAAQLQISEQTIRTHVQRMLRKLGTRDRLAIMELVPHAGSVGRGPVK
jgi:DNA-binding CsgD family transcriptional regulator